MSQINVTNGKSGKWTVVNKPIKCTCTAGGWISDDPSRHGLCGPEATLNTGGWPPSCPVSRYATGGKYFPHLLRALLCVRTPATKNSQHEQGCHCMPVSVPPNQLIMESDKKNPLPTRLRPPFPWGVGAGGRPLSARAVLKHNKGRGS